MVSYISSQDGPIENIMAMGSAKTFEFETSPAVPSELNEMIERELGETHKIRAYCLEALRMLLYEEKDLKSRIDDAFLLRFLRPAKFNVQRACKMIKRYYKLRCDAPSIFKDKFTPQDQRVTLMKNLATILPHKDDQGRTLFLIRPGAWDPSKTSKDDFFMSTLLMMELSVRDLNTLIKGTVVIVDMTGFSMSHIHHLTPTDLRRIVSMIQDCFPCRIKAIHIVNQPMIFAIIWNMISPFFSSKIASRIQLHGYNLQNFHQMVQPMYLPSCFGGKEPLSNTSRIKELLEMNDAFYHDAHFGYIDFQKDYKPRHSKDSFFRNSEVIS